MELYTTQIQARNSWEKWVNYQSSGNDHNSKVGDSQIKRQGHEEAEIHQWEDITHRNKCIPLNSNIDLTQLLQSYTKPSEF